MKKKLSILVPVYNEAGTIRSILEKIAGVPLISQMEKEIIMVDDCSGDGTSHIAEKYKQENASIAISIYRHERNRGKGASIKTAVKHATGDYIIVQDADLEYDPNEYNILLKPILDGYADVVYGSRFVGGRPHRVLFFWHSIGNKFLTFLSNMFSNLNITDMETGYKLFKAEFLKKIELQENRFGFEPEVTCKIARIPGIKIYEVGISYYGRTYKEGKKINFKDGIRAIYCILKYGLFYRK